MDKHTEGLNGLRLAYELVGNEGPLVVLLHGFLEDRTIWDKSRLSRMQQRFLLIDLPGHGASASVEYITIEEMASSVRAVLDECPVEPALIAGHSMGGYVALAYADQYNTPAVVLLNSTCAADTEEKKHQRTQAAQYVLAERRSFISGSIPNLFAPENREKHSEVIQSLIDRAASISPGSIVASLIAMRDRPDRSSLLNKSAIRVISGRKDAIIDIDRLEELPLVDHVILENTAHMGMFEQPDEFWRTFERMVRESVQTST